MPAVSSGLPCRLRTRMRKTTFSPRLNWLVSTQIGPVAPSGVLPRTMSPSTNSFWISCACADTQLTTAAKETAATIFTAGIEKPPWGSISVGATALFCILSRNQPAQHQKKAQGAAADRPSPMRKNRQKPLLLEIAQVRRRLVLLRRHQLAVGAQIVVFLADADVGIELRAHIRLPDRARTGIAEAGLQLLVGPRERIIDHGHLVVELVGIGLVEIDALLDDGVPVLVERNAGDVVAARQLQVPGLDLEHVVFAVAVLVDPFADRVAREGRLGVLRPIAAVGVDAAVGIVVVADQDVGGLRRHDDLGRIVGAR